MVFLIPCPERMVMGMSFSFVLRKDEYSPIDKVPGILSMNKNFIYIP